MSAETVFIIRVPCICGCIALTFVYNGSFRFSVYCVSYKFVVAASSQQLAANTHTTIRAQAHTGMMRCISIHRIGRACNAEQPMEMIASATTEQSHS